MLSVELAKALRPAGYEVRFQESYQLRIDRKGPGAPVAADLAGCVLLLEQVERERFPGLDQLPPGCRVVRFPSLDTNLLWPFSALNPYDLPEPPAVEGPYPYGDRILLRCIDQDWPVDRIVDHYLNHYPEYRLDMERIAVLERARREARDRQSDVKMADALDDLISTRSFATMNHPKPSLMRVLLARIALACERDVPEFSGPAIAEAVRDGFAEAGDWTCVPINPGVAAELGVTWSDPRDAETYVRGFVASAYANRARQREHGAPTFLDGLRWAPPFEGPIRAAGPVIGIYPDGFAAPLVRFELEALAPVARVAVDAYYPPQQQGEGAVACTLGGSDAEATVGPGTRFTLTLERRFAAGERALFTMSCSRTLNMFERGESEDNRDLGVLVLKMRAE